MFEAQRARKRARAIREHVKHTGKPFAIDSRHFRGVSRWKTTIFGENHEKSSKPAVYHLSPSTVRNLLPDSWFSVNFGGFWSSGSASHTSLTHPETICDRFPASSRGLGGTRAKKSKIFRNFRISASSRLVLLGAGGPDIPLDLTEHRRRVEKATKCRKNGGTPLRILF